MTENTVIWEQKLIFGHPQEEFMDFVFGNISIKSSPNSKSFSFDICSFFKFSLYICTIIKVKIQPNQNIDGTLLNQSLNNNVLHTKVHWKDLINSILYPLKS